jgi:hypothetical protein
MTSSTQWAGPALAALAIAGAAAADIPPQPSYVAGLWFDAGHHYVGPGQIVQDPLSLYGCRDGTANCAAAKAAHVIGAYVVSVNGDPELDPRQALATTHAPVVVVFRPAHAGAALIAVRFAPA